MALPTSVIADGNVKLLWVPAIANPAAPTVAELTATSVVDITCYLTTMTITTDEQTVTDDRLCSRQTFSRAGSAQDTLEFTYVYQGQEPTATDNKAQSTLLQGAVGYVAMRWGTAYEPAVAAGDIVDVYRLEAGVQRKQTPEKNSSLKIAQTMRPVDVSRRDVAVVAA
jgi:hypothetical protein